MNKLEKDQLITKLDDYQERALVTARPGMSEEDVDKYCCMKLSEEVGELVGRIAKYYFHNKSWDQANVKEELGDIMWYVSFLARNNNLDLSEIATFNIKKLAKRHGESFNRRHYEEG